MSKVKRKGNKYWGFLGYIEIMMTGCKFYVSFFSWEGGVWVGCPFQLFGEKNYPYLESFRDYFYCAY